MKTEYIIAIVGGGVATVALVYYFMKKKGTLEIVSAWASKTQVSRGEDIIINATFKNNGREEFVGTWNHEVAGFGGTNIPITIPPGKEITVARDYTIPNELGDGWYAISIYIADIYKTFPMKLQIMG